jgi:two-component system response regulator YesN
MLDKRLDSSYASAVADISGEAPTNYQIELVKRYIEKHIGDDVHLENVSEYVAMNPAYFSRFFKKHTGKSFIAYLSERRIERAKVLLKDPQNKVYDVCFMVGYFSKQHFYKLFHQYTGFTPIAYRNQVLKIEDDSE